MSRPNKDILNGIKIKPKLVLFKKDQQKTCTHKDSNKYLSSIKFRLKKFKAKTENELINDVGIAKASRMSLPLKLK